MFLACPVVVVASLAAQVPSVPPAAEPAPVELERNVAALERASRGRVSLTFEDAPLGEVIAGIGKDTGVETRGDWAMLELIGANSDDRIDFAVTDSSPLGAMAALAIQISKDQERPVVEALGGQVLLTLPLAMARLATAATYDVEDLILAKVAEPDANAQGVGDSGREERSQERIQERIGELEHLILEHVGPAEAWREFGGEAATVSWLDGRLVVTATPAMHLALRQLLDGLREGLPGTASVDLAVYRLPAAAIVELRKTAGDPRSLATEIARRHADRLVAAPRLLTRIGERGSITVGAAGAETLSFSIEARRDEERGITAVDLEWSESGGPAGPVRTDPTFIVSGRRATEVVISPPAAPGGPSTVLVVDVTLRGLERGPER
jgi:hypothetical protein